MESEQKITCMDNFERRLGSWWQKKRRVAKTHLTEERHWEKSTKCWNQMGWHRVLEYDRTTQIDGGKGVSGYWSSMLDTLSINFVQIGKKYDFLTYPNR